MLGNDLRKSKYDSGIGADQVRSNDAKGTTLKVPEAHMVWLFNV